MKLLFAIKFLHNAPGGAEKVLCILCNQLAKKGHDVTILSYDRKGSKPFYYVHPNIQIIQLNLPAKKTTLLNSIKRMWFLRKAVSTINPDIVIGFMHSMFIPLSISLAFLKKKIIASEHIVIEHYSNKRFEFFLLMLSSIFIKKISVINTEIKSKYPFFIRNKMTVISNPINENRNNFLQKNALIKRKFILSIGRLDEQKNHKLLIDAFNLIAFKYKNWTLHIYGQGNLYSELMSQIKKYKLEHRILIKKPIKNISAVYNSASFMALPSKYESFGLVVAEAMSHSLPVIALVDCANIKAILENRINGLLVSGKTYNEQVNQFAVAMQDLIVNEKDLVRLSKNAYATNLTHFDTHLIVQKWENLFNEVLIS